LDSQFPDYLNVAFRLLQLNYLAALGAAFSGSLPISAKEEPMKAFLLVMALTVALIGAYFASAQPPQPPEPRNRDGQFWNEQHINPGGPQAIHQRRVGSQRNAGDHQCPYMRSTLRPGGPPSSSGQNSFSVR
jgi:hypothetical protein